MSSIRSALVLGTAVGSLVALAAGGAVLRYRVSASLVDQLDRSLEDAARIYASTVEPKRKKGGFETEGLDVRELEDAGRPGFLEVWQADGQVLFRSPSLREADLERRSGTVETPLFWWLPLPGGQRGRAVGITFTPQVEIARAKAAESKAAPAATTQKITLVHARDAHSLDEQLSRFTELLISGGLCSMALLAGALWLAIRRGLRPLDQLAARIEKLDEQSLEQRIGLEGIPRELAPVRDRLNELLGRLESGWTRERTLSADMAHELRSPLAGLRTTLEVSLSRRREPAEYARDIEESLQITKQMQTIVDNLLSLTRLESGAVELQLQTVRPWDCIRATLKQLDETIRSRGLTIQLSDAGEALAFTDPSLLAAMIRNVVENAVEYCDLGGSVRIEATSNASTCEIAVSNTGSRISAEQADRVFDKLWRGDAARSSEGCHCGLGLALVKRMVTVLGGSARVQSSTGGEFRITLSLPASCPESPAPGLPLPGSPLAPVRTGP